MTDLKQLDRDLGHVVSPTQGRWLQLQRARIAEVNPWTLVLGVATLTMLAAIFSGTVVFVSVLLLGERERWAVRAATCESVSRQGAPSVAALDFLARNCAGR